MKGIQINNFFNNHISLNGKKNNSKQPNLFCQGSRPEPIVFNHNNPNEQEPQQVISYDTLTPHMKAFNKQPVHSTRKKRTNTIDAVTKPKQISRKSKGKKSNSYQKFRKTVSLDKCNQKDTSQQHDVSKTLNKNYKKPKISRNKNQPQSQGVKRSKSAIIKNTNSKVIEGKQTSRQFVRESKKNIISSDNSFKEASKKQIKKQTQNLINKKQNTEKVECKTARVQSTKVKSRKNKDKIIGQINKSVQKQDSKSFKFHTQRKTTGVTASKSYLTSAKQSKPVSARERKPSKKLFDNKDKKVLKIQSQENPYQKFEDFINDSEEQQNSQVKQALHELQQVLQGMNSKKSLAKQLKKFTFKLKNIPSKNNSEQNSSQSEQEQSNSQAFKRIKDFKNNLVKKKLNEAKMSNQQKQPHKQQGLSIKKSSKKLAKHKNKLQESSKNRLQESNKHRLQVISKNKKKSVRQQKNIDENEGNMMQSDENRLNDTSQPQVFKNTQQQQSKYIKSGNVSQFNENTLRQLDIDNNKYDKRQFDNNNNDKYEIRQYEQDEQDVILNETNKKYMQFLKNLQQQNQNNNKDINKLQIKQKQKYEYKQKQQKQYDKQKSDNLIQDINTYLNRQYINVNKQYNSQKPVDYKLIQQHNINPILQRRKGQNYPISNISQYHNLQHYLTDHDNNQYQDNKSDQHYFIGHIQKINYNKLSQIQALKSFQKQSDQMMNKVGINKYEQNKKNLTIDLNDNMISKGQQIIKGINKALSSPKYDDRYPHIIKSPKLSDIQITNILAVKQKCLVSKHSKMNQLVQRMYQKQLVSPKSYQYYVYQLKKQYQQQSDAIDGFKQQASQILNEINRQKDDIKVIDQLIREQKWQQARKLMKNENKMGINKYFGFKKNKDKTYQIYDDNLESNNQIINNNKEPQLVVQNISPSKRNSISVFNNNINITIKPQHIIKQSNKQIINNKKQKIEIQKNQFQRLNNEIKTKNGLIRQQRKISMSSSQQQYQTEQNQGSISKKLDFQFQQRYKLKSNDDLNIKNNLLFNNDNKLQLQLNNYLGAQRADSQDFENYVYYHSQQVQDTIGSQLSKQQKVDEQVVNNRLKPQGIFKLFEVQKSNTQQQQQQQQNSEQVININQNQNMKININQNNNMFNKQYNKINKQNYKKIIQIDQREPKQQIKSQNIQHLINVPNINHFNSTNNQFEHNKQQQQNQNQDYDNLSDSNSILELQLRKGFQSNLFFIKQYCISLCQYIRDNPNIKNNFKFNISQPLQFNTQQLLHKYRTTIDGNYTNQYNSTINLLQYKTDFRKPPNKAISSQLAQQFNKTYGPLKFWNRDLTKKGREKYHMEKQAQSIFLSAILEVLNQSLDFQRPGSIFGKPLIWANNSKHLKNMKYLNGQKTKKVSDDSQQSAQTYDFIFGVAIARIIQWGSCLCGFLPDTAELENTQIDDDYVVHIRQTRMAFLLQKMLAEQEATFNNSELQQTQIMLYLGKAISQQLINEVSEQISSIRNQSFNEN